MAPISAKSKSSGSSITISIVDFQNIIANTIRMVGNASYSYSLSISSGKSPEGKSGFVSHTKLTTEATFMDLFHS